MDYIKELEKLNITYKNFDEETINFIIANEYSFCKLFEFSTLFEKYNSTNKIGKFINLDFEHLYSIAKIDEELSDLIICEFLEIERTLKAQLLALKNEFNLSNATIRQYIQTDVEYLNKIYIPDNRQVLLKYSKPIEELSFEQFLDVIQFGTFQRFNSYIYNTLDNNSYTYDNYLTSALKLRNKVAHCETIITQLQSNVDYGSEYIVSFLRKKGIKHKTLTTNISKSLVFDFCNLLFLYCSIEPQHKIEKNHAKLCSFLDNCKNYSNLFSKNPTLVSVYNFMESVVEIFKCKIN